MSQSIHAEENRQHMQEFRNRRDAMSEVLSREQFENTLATVHKSRVCYPFVLLCCRVLKNHDEAQRQQLDRKIAELVAADMLHLADDSTIYQLEHRIVPELKARVKALEEALKSLMPLGMMHEEKEDPWCNVFDDADAILANEETQ